MELQSRLTCFNSPKGVTTIPSAKSVAFGVVGEFRSGAPRSTKMGTFRSPWHYDVGTLHALLPERLRLPSISHHASMGGSPPTSRASGLPLDTRGADPSGDRRDGPEGDIPVMTRRQRSMLLVVPPHPQVRDGIVEKGVNSLAVLSICTWPKSARTVCKSPVPFDFMGSLKGPLARRLAKDVDFGRALPGERS
jgi:hypothetical protein